MDKRELERFAQSVGTHGNQMNDSGKIALEKHYSVDQVAALWGISENTVRRIFEDVPGVLKISLPRLLANRKHKPKVLLRIPVSVLERLHAQRSAGFSLETKRGRRRI